MSNWFAPDRQVTTRKLHYCEACANPIFPGEQIIYQCGSYEREFFSRYLHVICKEIWFFTYDGWEELGDFWDALYGWLTQELGNELGDLCFQGAREFQSQQMKEVSNVR